MKLLGKRLWISCLGLTLSGLTLQAQTVNWISSREGNIWMQAKVKLVKNAEKIPDLSVEKDDSVVIFRAWYLFQ